MNLFKLLIHFRVFELKSWNAKVTNQNVPHLMIYCGKKLCLKFLQNEKENDILTRLGPEKIL